MRITTLFHTVVSLGVTGATTNTSTTIIIAVIIVDVAVVLDVAVIGGGGVGFVAAMITGVAVVFYPVLIVIRICVILLNRTVGTTRRG